MDSGTIAAISALLVAAGGAIGVIITKLVDAYRAYRADKVGETTQERVSSLAEFKYLLDAQKFEIIELRGVVKRLQEEHSQCREDHGKAEERIGYLEDALTNAKIPFHRRASGDSGRHFKSTSATDIGL